jgi:hypothetical protein
MGNPARDALSPEFAYGKSFAVGLEPGAYYRIPVVDGSGSYNPLMYLVSIFLINQ